MVGIVVVFLIVLGVIQLREWIWGVIGYDSRRGPGPSRGRGRYVKDPKSGIRNWVNESDEKAGQP